MKTTLLLVLLLSFPTTFARSSDTEEALELLNKVSSLELKSVKKVFHVKGLVRNFQLFDYVLETKEKRKVKFAYYKSKNTKTKRPLVFIMPAIGGFTPMETVLAAYFAAKGFNVVVSMISADISDFNREPEKIEQMFLETNSDTRGVIDYVAKFPEINKDKIVAVGTSLGGIRLSMMLAVEKRIKATALIVAGGDIPEIMANSKQGSVRKYREYQMKKRNLGSEVEYQNLLSHNLRIDPLITSSYLNPDDIIMFRSSIDKDVPYKNQDKLWEALGQPRSYKFRLPHIPAAGYAALVKAPTMRRFFLKRFAQLEANRPKR